MSTPKIILGTMTFGLDTTNAATSAVRIRGAENVRPLLESFHSFGHVELDTARIYCNGDTEIVLASLPTDHFAISTKVWPGGPGAHNAENLRKTFSESREALQHKKVDIFYLHAPDYTTPFEETLKAINDLYREGLFKRFGLSNFASWQVMLIYQICKQNGYVLPTVYQGMYNAITRDVAKELLPCLKSLNIAFYAYNPIAGGILAGKVNMNAPVAEGGRFDDKTPIGRMYRQRYWNKIYADAISNLNDVANANGLTLLESALRWMRHHAGLGPNDGIIIGASSLAQLEDNLKVLEGGPLPQAMLEAFDDAWESVKGSAAPYFKSEADTKALATVLISK
ncbi:hypothetical protein BGW38_001311 [Lunasporangiospora selenospora]|uniref:NADP-dependent oxidoreductase domain-containing protein n=1 Tax=Lunasporangiospora selenospora TaxID=979761 RepID=A0A9P6FUH5_9FUNG|nr:hypothetical protein BGW38_001311 [Lunasporangiospora selenospora]